jgi:molybdopterin synthase sulfur carrier subunit
MQLQLLAFAQAAEVAGFRERVVECSASETARALMERVAPTLDLGHTRVAFDGEYRGWDEPIGNARELALLPPVSGG